jgi:hypothetical protein
MSNKVRGLFESAGNFPIFRAQDAKGGMLIVKNKAARNAIPAQFRVLDTKRTTMCYIEGDDMYYLINNPPGNITADSDWAVALASGQPEVLIGTWKDDNTDPVLQDTDSDGDNNGDYYFVRGAPTDKMVTHAGLFLGNTETIKNGDMIVSANGKWVVRRFDPNVFIPEELIVRQYVADITERDNLDRWEGMAVVVKDAGDDPNVQVGFSAEYLYKPSSGDADAQGFVHIINPNLNTAGQNIETATGITITGPGKYIYTGSGNDNFVLPDISTAMIGDEVWIKNLATNPGDVLTVDAANAGEIWDEDQGYDDFGILRTSRWVTFIAGTNYWIL